MYINLSRLLLLYSSTRIGEKFYILLKVQINTFKILWVRLFLEAGRYKRVRG